MHRLRLSVRENQLTEGASVTEESYAAYLGGRGITCLAELDGRLAGFAVLDRPTASIWALFVNPEMEGRGVGGALHDHLIRAAAAEGFERLSLSTEPGTKAARFYGKRGWRSREHLRTGELLLERRLEVR